ncbi:hypothetical protein BCV70DRAFT_197204 [Testicularia cyperi]|uniref:Uncharacterized protein n=1 Tax=Testicularia cyperi TaxID=1882483 RepID=A0A317XYF6_9BASI|nr:hypothetical protein BCV70DRAFT_197204 [Testicularia cyperi]
MKVYGQILISLVAISGWLAAVSAMWLPDGTYMSASEGMTAFFTFNVPRGGAQTYEHSLDLAKAKVIEKLNSNQGAFRRSTKRYFTTGKFNTDFISLKDLLEGAVSRNEDKVQFQPPELPPNRNNEIIDVWSDLSVMYHQELDDLRIKAEAAAAAARNIRV